MMAGARKITIASKVKNAVTIIALLFKGNVAKAKVAKDSAAVVLNPLRAIWNTAPSQRLQTFCLARKLISRKSDGHRLCDP